MVCLPDSLAAWGRADFNQVVQREVEALELHMLPLQQGLAQGSCVSDSAIRVMVLSNGESPETIHVKLGIFYQGIIAGCNCADDPSPVDELPEYCEVVVDIDKHSAVTRISLAGDAGQ